jgi:hypothetical protein
MKIFVFNYIAELTDRYHSGGGMAIIAKDISSAKEYILGYPDITPPTDDDWDEVDAFDLVDPNAKPCLWVFPDAGCC